MDKQEILEDYIEQFSTVTDGLGKKIDSRILRSVTLLNLLGFHIHQSCHGHLDIDDENGYPFAWISFNTKTEEEIKSNVFDFHPHDYYFIQDQSQEKANEKTREKFSLRRDQEIDFSNKEMADFHDAVYEKNMKSDTGRYKYFQSFHKKIKEERKKLDLQLKKLIKNFYHGDISVSNCRISFLDEKKSENYAKNIDLDGKFYIYKKSINSLHRFEEFLMQKYLAE